MEQVNKVKTFRVHRFCNLTNKKICTYRGYLSDCEIENFFDENFERDLSKRLPYVTLVIKTNHTYKTFKFHFNMHGYYAAYDNENNTYLRINLGKQLKDKYHPDPIGATLGNVDDQLARNGGTFQNYFFIGIKENDPTQCIIKLADSYGEELYKTNPKDAREYYKKLEKNIPIIKRDLLNHIIIDNILIRNTENLPIWFKEDKKETLRKAFIFHNLKDIGKFLNDDVILQIVDIQKQKMKFVKNNDFENASLYREKEVLAYRQLFDVNENN